MKKNIKLIILPLLMVFLFSCDYKQNNILSDIEKPIQPIICTDEDEGEPVITSLSTFSGTIDTKIEIN